MIIISVYVIPILLLFHSKLCYVNWLYPIIVYYFNSNKKHIKYYCKKAFILQFIYFILNIFFIILIKYLINYALRIPYPIYTLKLISTFMPPIIFINTAIFVILSFSYIINAYNEKY